MWSENTEGRLSSVGKQFPDAMAVNRMRRLSMMTPLGINNVAGYPAYQIRLLEYTEFSCSNDFKTVRYVALNICLVALPELPGFFLQNKF
jgi:hypothetical protein